MSGQCDIPDDEQHILDSTAFHLVFFHDAPEWAVGGPQWDEMDVEIWIGNNMRFDWLTFPYGAEVGQVPCNECGGSGWWGFGPRVEETGPCVDCKGTGRVWVGLL